jgi:hypothetical protein
MLQMGELSLISSAAYLTGDIQYFQDEANTRKQIQG